MKSIFQEINEQLMLNPKKAREMALYVEKREQELSDRLAKVEKDTGIDSKYLVNDKVKQLWILGEISRREAVTLDFFANFNEIDKQILIYSIYKRYSQSINKYLDRCAKLNDGLVSMNIAKMTFKSNMENAEKLMNIYNNSQNSNDFSLNTRVMLASYCKAGDFVSTASASRNNYFKLKEQCEEELFADIKSSRDEIKKLSKSAMHDAKLLKYFSVLNNSDDGMIVYKTVQVLRNSLYPDTKKLLRTMEKEEAEMEYKLSSENMERMFGK